MVELLEAVMDLEPSRYLGMNITRKAYPSDVSDEEWALVAPYLCLLPEDAGQRSHPLREVFNGLRYIIKTGAQWRGCRTTRPQGRRPLASLRGIAFGDGRRSISRPSAGWRLAALRRWPMICAL